MHHVLVRAAGCALLALSLFAPAAHAATEITYSDGGTLALGGSGTGTITGYGGDLAVAVNGRTVARAHLAPAGFNAATPRAIASVDATSRARRPASTTSRRPRRRSTIRRSSRRRRISSICRTMPAGHPLCHAQGGERVR